MKVIQSIWFHCKADTTGIVICENDVGERKAYVGTASGLNLEMDEKFIISKETEKILLLNEGKISDWGSKISPETLRRLADTIEGK